MDKEAEKSVPMGSMMSPVHCAQWERWGYIGIALKWSSLVACLLIVALQMVWRLAPQHNLYGNIYVASSTIETTVSAIFILKLLLNFYLTPADSQKRVLLNYITPIVAFVISAGLGVGNLVVFAFTETSLGRFLRGVEVYLLFIYYLVFTFRKHVRSTASTRPSVIEIFQEDEKERFGGRPGSQWILPTTTPPLDPLSRLAHQSNRTSAFSKVSSWIASARNSRRLTVTEQFTRPKSWRLTLNRPESGISLGSDLLATPTMKTAQEADLGSDAPLGNNTNTATLKTAPSFTGDDRSMTEVTFSYYGVEHSPMATGQTIPLPDRDSSILGTASPVYGLNGIILPTKAKVDAESTLQAPPPAVTSPSPGDVTPVTKLFQEQSILDQSIAALRRVRFEQDEDKRPNNPSADSVESARSAATRSTIYSSKVSSPNASDFSLSVFPEPPTTPAPQTPSATGFRQLPPRPTSPGNFLRPSLKRTPPTGIIPIQLELSQRPDSASGLPFSPNFDSAGTQYDVTSFIGDLSSPRGYPPFSGYIASSGIMPNSGALSIQSTDDGDGWERPAAADTPPTSTTYIEDSSPPPAVASETGLETPPPAPTTTSAPPLRRTPSRPLGSATMSSSLPKPGQKPVEQQSQLPPQNLALRTFLTRNGSNSSTGSRVVPPLGHRHSRNNSLASTIRAPGRIPTNPI
ncbi:hypothetical protein CC2G_000997 [Coprinopsis cinerea AmutBmut pab1-1]|nr:hypothetical protein CC2G_000997 [Coprinopsis cinerea AmutBmut pab1-1]